MNKPPFLIRTTTPKIGHYFYSLSFAFASIIMLLSIPIAACFLLFPIILPTFCHLPDQPPLIANGHSGTMASSSSQGQILASNSASSAGGGCLFCSSSSCGLSSLKQFPYPGWLITAISGNGTSQGGNGGIVDGAEECQDRSPKCVDFAALCANSLYQLFLRSHCPLSCGHCRGKAAMLILPTPPPFVPKQQRRFGQRRRVLAPTKRKGIGEKGSSSTTAANSTLKMMTTMTTTEMRTTTMSTKETAAATTTIGEVGTTTRNVPNGGCGPINGNGTSEGSTSPSSSSISITTPSTMPSSTPIINGGTFPSTTAAASTPLGEIGTGTTGSVPSECEDIGQNCPALKANCADIAQRDILGVFCRKTCGFC